MKLEHLIQAYNFNNIHAEVEKEIEDDVEKAVVLKFNENISASCLIDAEGIVVSINLFSNCVVTNNKTLINQLEHTVTTLNIIKKTIELLGNTSKEEANNILKELNMFKDTLKTKAVRFLNTIHKVNISNGILIYSMTISK